jgi:membrane associated rhomboid family serine protease
MTLNPITSEPQLRQCPVCGNPTPAANASCAHCGAVYAEAEMAAREAATEYRFLSALFTRSNPFTMIFIGINAGVFLLMCLAGGFSVASADPEVLRGFGAKQNILIAEQDQYWRLITSIFIHIGFIHLFLNNYALWIIGQEIERIYGSARFVVLYLATGVIGSLGSYVFNPDATSAGASGAIFGLFGVMATFAFKYRKEIPKTLSSEIRRRVLPVIALNLVFGFSVKIVDNAAHVGGLLAGIVLALAVPYMRPTEKLTPLVWRALQVICLIVISVSFAAAFGNYNGPRLALSNLTSRTVSSLATYTERMEEGDRFLVESFRSFGEAIENRNRPAEVKQAIDTVEKGIRAVDSAPRVDPQADQYRTRLLDLLTQQKSLLNELAQSTSGNEKRMRQAEEALNNEHNRFVSDFEAWWQASMKQRGYRSRESNER